MNNDELKAACITPVMYVMANEQKELVKLQEYEDLHKLNPKHPELPLNFDILKNNELLALRIKQNDELEKVVHILDKIQYALN
jgi:hypothetical protein